MSSEKIPNGIELPNGINIIIMLYNYSFTLLDDNFPSLQSAGTLMNKGRKYPILSVKT